MGKRLKIAILGWGREGRSVTNFLKNRLGDTAEIFVLDEKRVAKKDRLVEFKFRVGARFKNLAEFDLLLRSPGVPYLNSEIQKAIKAGVSETTATNIFIQEILKARSGNEHPKIIGITGTKGKSTVSAMLFEILKKAKKKVVLAGNIGTPALDVLEEAKLSEYIVLELSSFQLQDLKQAVDISIFLAIYKDHLDYHRSMKEYISAKLELIAQQEKGSLAYVVSESLEFLDRLPKIEARVVELKTKATELFDKNELRVVGKHNFKNAIVASSVARSFGIAKTPISYATEHFKGLPHRLEFLRKINKVSIYNDSFSTTSASTQAAVKAFKDPTILMVGGRPKIRGYIGLRNAIKESSVMGIVVFGENAKALERNLHVTGVKIVFGGSSLASVVKRGYTLANNLQTEAVLLFSPATASFDMFKSASERGERFRQVVEKL